MIVAKGFWALKLVVSLLVLKNEGNCAPRASHLQKFINSPLLMTLMKSYECQSVGRNFRRPLRQLKSTPSASVPATDVIDRTLTFSRKKPISSNCKLEHMSFGHTVPSSPKSPLGISCHGRFSFCRFLSLLLPNPPAGPVLFDWRENKTIYPKVRNQFHFGRCGTCWAFAPVSALEILYSKIYNKRTHFSKQQLVDCCPETYGCDGGDVFRALTYLVSDGVTLEENYRYVGAKRTCRTDVPIAAKIASFTQVEESESAIVEALHWSPLVVNLHYPIEIEIYFRGVANPVGCRDDIFACDHSAVIVGHGEDYWIIRNSLGESFGYSGHYYLRKGTCSVGREVYSITL